MLTAKAREQEDTILDYMDKESTFRKLEKEHHKLTQVITQFIFKEKLWVITRNFN